ncbi:enoyl-CoA hydratase [Bacillus sp. FJAT-47783]|uniref:enoyl-CoA hydratase n=1 Tax=Bacillus sp. FJAT-47783 TaxID=2922712 RepID=UPI001FAE0B11|nr:enoyl-CoA hydratase [Bacillus sp. FJAT-47783]
MGETFRTVNLLLQESYAHLQLNRPDSLNALDEEMLTDLSKALSIVESAKVPLLFISGAGRAFSAGGDIKTMLQSSNNDRFKEIMEKIEHITLSLYRLPAVTVSLVHGAAAGLGLSLALASDYVYAHNDAKIAMNFINIGLIPDGGGHFHMAKRLGEGKAKQIIWEGKTHAATTALELGIIDDVFEERVEDKLEKEKERLLNKPLKAMVASKEIFVQMNEPSLQQSLRLEAHFQGEMRQTSDHQEGIRAFLEKRRPTFSGK